MTLLHAFKSLSRKERLSEEGARRLTAALLDEGVPELEEGAILALLEERVDDMGELKGSSSALAERCFHLEPPRSGARPVILPSHAGTLEDANLTALVALSLQRLNVPARATVPRSLFSLGSFMFAQVYASSGASPPPGGP